MKVTITIRCENDAFADAPGDELARILENLAARFRAIDPEAPDGCRLFDVNGNHVGELTVSR